MAAMVLSYLSKQAKGNTSGMMVFLLKRRLKPPVLFFGQLMKQSQPFNPKTNMENLTVGEIDKILLKFPEARKIAVYNFLGTVGNNPSAMTANMNLSMDARSYKWKAQTVEAIRVGISYAASK